MYLAVIGFAIRTLNRSIPTREERSDRKGCCDQGDEPRELEQRPPVLRRSPNIQVDKRTCSEPACEERRAPGCGWTVYPHHPTCGNEQAQVTDMQVRRNQQRTHDPERDHLASRSIHPPCAP